MAPLTGLISPATAIVADASAIINLNASGCAKEIIKALPGPMVVVDIVPNELDTGRSRGRRDADLLEELVGANLVEIVKLNEVAEQHFERLVVGSAIMTLDDGEAATIAYAVERGAVAVIDEKKASRICAERFQNLRLICTTEMFIHADATRRIPRETLAQGIICALQLARMSVPQQHVEWVVDLIGQEQATLCTSLPRSVRLPGREVLKQKA